MLARQLLQTKNETTNLSSPSSWFTKLFGYEASSGEKVTVRSSLGVPAVYACVNILANSIAALPFQLYKQNDEGRERDKKHKVYRLLEKRPNPYQTPFRFKHLMETHRNTWGNAYVNIDWGADGRPEALWLLNPSTTEPILDVKNNKVWFWTTLPDGTYTRLAYDDVLHVTALSTDGLKGIPPIQLIRESIGSSQAAQKFKGSFYKNGAANNGFLKIPQMLNKDAKDVIRTEWEQANTGITNAQRIAILDAGLEFQSTSMPLKDAQFVESMKADKTDVATFFNIPLHMVNELDRTTHSNIEGQAIGFLRHTMNPIMVQYQEEFDYKLFSIGEQKKYYLKFNLESLLRADKKTQAEFYQIMIDKGIFSINEVRELEERNAIEGGDQHRVDLNHVSLDKADEYQLAKAGSLKGGEGD